MSDLGWTIESIGYNKDANAYLAKVSAGVAGSAIVANAMVNRSQQKKSDNFQLIVFFYLVTGFAVGTWGYVKQAIIWFKGAQQSKVNWGAALAHILIPPIALMLPAVCIWSGIQYKWMGYFVSSPIGFIACALAIFAFFFIAAYSMLAGVNKRSKVDDFIGFGAAAFQTVSCFIAYAALAVLIVNSNADNTPPTIRKDAKSTITNQQNPTNNKQASNANNEQGQTNGAGINAFNAMGVTDPAARAELNRGHRAFVYDPPSNVRNSPKGDILCSIGEPTNITVYDYAGSTYDGSREVKWYYTDACGSMGVIAYSQFR